MAKRLQLFLRKCRDCISSVGVWVCAFGINIILHHIIISFCITSHHTLYRINGMNWIRRWSLENASKKWKCAKAQNKPWEIQLHRPGYKRGDPLFTKHGYFYEAWMFLRSMDLFSLRSMKRREGVFSPKAQKRYVCKVFMHRKEMTYNNLHIRFKAIHIKYYSLITIKVHWSSQNVFTINVIPLWELSLQLRAVIC
jgi:hypothetical protein